MLSVILGFPALTAGLQPPLCVGISWSLVCRQGNRAKVLPRTASFPFPPSHLLCRGFASFC